MDLAMMERPAPASPTPDKTEGALELVGLRRAFGSFNALDGIDLSIARGEFIALLGPSGCGKSTALNCIAGLLALTGGEIRLDGRRIDELTPEKRGFGMVFQSYALFPHLSVRRNVGFGLAMRGVSKADAEDRIRAALALVRLEDQIDKLPGQLSGGQQQRVAIARAVVIRPPVVLMDEPLSNLDAKLRLEMRAEIRGIHDKIGSTTIYVTHDQDEALSLADRIVVMSRGRIRQIGTPEDLYERPADPDVADFMGFRNRLAGHVRNEGAGGMPRVEAGGGSFPVRGGLQAAAIGPVTVSIRPEDLMAGEGEGIAARVVSIEYRGRAFFGMAETGSGEILYFRSDRSHRAGDAIVLVPAPDRTLLFPAGGA